MCTLGHPNKIQDGLRRLYEEVLLADSELKHIIQDLPPFFRHGESSQEPSSATAIQQKQILHLSNAHKVKGQIT